ncbi:putative pectinesterase 53 [Platanthera zijinensis]|uniref:Pectinesterase 53 n=1 Tax=Platanthera zijinensis TaxID=2320716 RepID=A0AAP0B1U4_9ASPA
MEKPIKPEDIKEVASKGEVNKEEIIEAGSPWEEPLIQPLALSYRPRVDLTPRTSQESSSNKFEPAVPFEDPTKAPAYWKARMTEMAALNEINKARERGLDTSHISTMSEQRREELEKYGSKKFFDSDRYMELHPAAVPPSVRDQKSLGAADDFRSKRKLPIQTEKSSSKRVIKTKHQRISKVRSHRLVRVVFSSTHSRLQLDAESISARRRVDLCSTQSRSQLDAESTSARRGVDLSSTWSRLQLDVESTSARRSVDPSSAYRKHSLADMCRAQIDVFLTVWLGQYNCSGRGAVLSKRVKWSRSLTNEEARPYLDRFSEKLPKWTVTPPVTPSLGVT